MTTSRTCNVLTIPKRWSSFLYFNLLKYGALFCIQVVYTYTMFSFRFLTPEFEFPFPL